jgi:chromosome segregation ATPase
MSDHLIAEAHRHAMALPTTHPTHADIAWYVREVSELRAEVKESKARERAAIASWDEERQRALREGGRVVELRAEVQRLKHGTVAQFKDAFIDELKRENTELRVSCDEHAKGYVETRKRIAALESEIDRLHAINAVRESAIARAERAEAELKAEQDNSAINEIELRVSRAIVSKIWVQLGSPTYEQLKGRSIYDLIDELKAELAKERARLDWLMAGGVCTVQHTGEFHVSRLHAPVSRAAIDAAMKEDAK